MLEGFGSRATVVRRTLHGSASALGTLTLAGARPPQRAQRAGGRGRRPASSRVPFAGDRRGAGRVPRRRAPVRAQGRGEAASRSSTTTGTTRPRSPRCCAPREPPAPRRIVCVFQPHRYPRTAQLLHEFGPALALADEVVLTDIYAAGEDPMPGVTIEAAGRRGAASARRPRAHRQGAGRRAGRRRAAGRAGRPGADDGRRIDRDAWDPRSWRRSRRGR